jgi:hypothetical protein
MNLLDEPKYRDVAKRVNEGFAAVNRAEVIPLLELCRELARDAERYRWLRAVDDNAPLDASGYPSLTQWKCVVSDRAGRLLFGKELDAAIDAAMREQGANA